MTTILFLIFINYRMSFMHFMHNTRVHGSMECSLHFAYNLPLGYHFAMKIDAIQTRNAYLKSNKKKKRYRIRWKDKLYTRKSRDFAMFNFITFSFDSYLFEHNKVVMSEVTYINSTWKMAYIDTKNLQCLVTDDIRPLKV